MSSPVADQDRRGTATYAAMLAFAAVVALRLVVPPGSGGDGARAVGGLLAVGCGVWLTDRLYGASLRSRTTRGGLEALLLCGAIVGVSAVAILTVLYVVAVALRALAS